MQAGREIKFRAWDKENKAMRYCAEQAYNGHWQMNDIQHFGQLIDNPKYELMQFTGLRDMSENEIYERDIALIYGDRCVIEYDSKSASYVARTKIDSYWALDEETFKLGVEVIGNIYENPDLLRSA